MRPSAREADMSVKIEDQAGIKVVLLQGELAGDDGGEFVDAVTNLLTGPGARIVIDLGAVPFVNSTGLSELVRVNSQANIQEARVVLANPSPFVAGVLQTTRLDRFFEVCENIAQALAKLG
jgi:anti-sigma B factor antagonist